MYQPNFADPRVLNRIKHALGFSLAVMNPDKDHQWSTRLIDKYFGQQQKPLSKFLRNHLLICTSDRYNKDLGECKSYRLNMDGVMYIKSILSGSPIDSKNNNQDPVGVHNNDEKRTTTKLYPSVYHLLDNQYDLCVVSQFIDKEYKEELISGNFHYDNKSYRMWHGLQSVKNQYRKPILASYGYTYNYDIQACAPTLLLQYSRHIGNDSWLPVIQEYIDDRGLVRSRLSTELGIPKKDVKVLINALFCGAKLGTNPQFSLFHLLRCDPLLVNKIKSDPYISQLRTEIKDIWSYINQEIPRLKKLDKKGRLRLVPISSRDRWNIYFRLECQVMTSIRNYISNNNLKCFLEHDGWVCDNQIDTNKLSEWIHNDCGFNIKLDLEKRTTTKLYPSVYHLLETNNE